MEHANTPSSEDEAYFEPFINLPPRALKDYYRVVKDPMSLRKLQKITKGVRGRNEATGTTDLKSWAAFEETASLLWDNAKYYNEEGSEIYELARELQVYLTLTTTRSTSDSVAGILRRRNQKGQGSCARAFTAQDQA